MQNLTALVLAGGQSVRMGQDKAQLVVAGCPLITQVCAAALACADTVQVLTPWPERYQDLVPEEVSFIQETVLTAEEERLGPLAAFAYGLEHIDTDWVLLLACDLPNLEGSLFQSWATKLAYLPETTLAYLPKLKDWWDPLCGFYRRQCITSLHPFLQSGGRSFQRWLETISVQEIPQVDPEYLINLNTPEDLTQINAK